MTAYYNENDPYAAQWLRNLIAAGHIAPGDVDDRSILDVKASELKDYVQCHFFAGIGGWSLALRLAGWPDNRPVWTGSCPCQPLSVSGLGHGPLDKRHLWPTFYALIAQRRPPTIFGEQVASALGREWLAAVRADLESTGYAVGAADLPAAGVAAPHGRARLWLVAYPYGERGRCGDSSRKYAEDAGESPRNPWGGHWHPESKVGRVANGVPDRARRLRAYGNAIVPQVAAEFVMAAMEL